MFRKQYGLNAKSSTEEIATAAAKDLSKHLADFGAMDKALMAYNAGAGGLRTYLKGGLSDSKRKEVAGYAPGFQKWFAGVSGKSTVDNSILMPTQADQLELINKAAESQKAIDDAKKMSMLGITLKLNALQRSIKIILKRLPSPMLEHRS